MLWRTFRVKIDIKFVMKGREEGEGQASSDIN